MAVNADDPIPSASVERFVARRVTGWEQRDGAVVLQVEGVQADGSAIDQIEMAIGVLESGALRLTVGLVGAPGERRLGLLSEPEPDLAPLAVTTAEDGVKIASERHARYGPDPEDVHVEIRNDPLLLSIVDAGGRTILSLDATLGPDRPTHGLGALDWTYSSAVSGLPARALPRATVSLTLPLEPGEHIYGLDAQDGPLDRVGSLAIFDAAAADADTPPRRFMLSSRGPGLFMHSRARIVVDLDHGKPGLVYSVQVDEPTLDLFLFPATWPRTAISAFTALTGRPELATASAFAALEGEGATGAADGAPAQPDDLRRALQSALAAGLALPGRWPELHAPPAHISPALLVRWAQASLLAPFARVRDTTDERALAIIRAYAQLRFRLLPYLLHCAQETAQQGLPMLRPLLLEFSWDADALTIDDQYLLGRDLLVAPIFDGAAGEVTRRVYLPRYANWYDWWTGRFEEGGRWVETTAPLERVPIFARAGTAIPLGGARDAIDEESVTVTKLLLFAPADGAIGASIELPDGELMGVEHERGADRARIFIEGLPPSVRTLEIVGIPATAEIVDAASPHVQIVAGESSLPGLGGHWESITVSLDADAYTTGLELHW